VRGVPPDFLEFFSDRHAATHAAFFVPYVKPGMQIPDRGCGPGSITLDFAEIVAPGRAIGIDIGPAQITKRRSCNAGGISEMQSSTSGV
jgi:ubiquinone/menaquinone biosynthesis C-methylase UbiE